MKKVIIAGLVVVLAGIGAGVWWLHGNLDNLVRAAIEDYGSQMTGAKVSVGSVEIHPTDGKGTIRKLVVGNPSGFKTAHLMSVNEITVAVDIASLTKDVILVKQIAVAAPDVIYEKGEQMTNIDAIQKNIAAYLGPQKPDAKPRKLIVEDFSIRGARAQASAAFMKGKTVEVPLPDIALKNIGKSKGGVTPGELGAEITAAVKQRLTSAISFDRLLKGAGQVLKDTGDAIKNIFK